MSRIDWYALVPPVIARQQIRWERRRMAVKLDALGYKQYEIAARLGLTIDKVRMLFAAARRHPDERAPVERWQAEGGDIAALARKLRITTAPTRKPRRPCFKWLSRRRGGQLDKRPS